MPDLLVHENNQPVCTSGKISPFSLTAETGDGYRSIEKPAKLIEPASATPPIGGHVRWEAYRSARVGTPPQEGTQRIYEL